MLSAKSQVFQDNTFEKTKQKPILRETNTVSRHKPQRKNTPRISVNGTEWNTTSGYGEYDTVRIPGMHF